MWAICEQLIDSDRAAAIERRLVARLGRRCRASGLRDAPDARAVAAAAPAELEACGLAGKRAIALSRAAREVASGRVDLYAPWATRRLAPAPRRSTGSAAGRSSRSR